jgi:hypothetical protein
MDQPPVAPKFANAVRDMRRALQEIADPYRPELHYMRGPGPKWHERHAPVRRPAPARHSATAKTRG